MADTRVMLPGRLLQREPRCSARSLPDGLLMPYHPRVAAKLNRFLLRSLFLARAHPGPDHSDQADDEGSDAVGGVVVVAAGKVSWKERGQRARGFGEVDDGNHDQREARDGQQCSDVRRHQSRRFWHAQEPTRQLSSA